MRSCSRSKKMGCLSAFTCEEKKNPKYTGNINYVLMDLPDIEKVRQCLWYCFDDCVNSVGLNC